MLCRAKNWQSGNNEPVEEGDSGQEMAPRLCIVDCNASEEERWSLGGSESLELIGIESELKPQDVGGQVVRQATSPHIGCVRFSSLLQKLDGKFGFQKWPHQPQQEPIDG